MIYPARHHAPGVHDPADSRTLAGRELLSWLTFFVVLIVASQYRPTSDLARYTLWLVVAYQLLTHADKVGPVVAAWIDNLNPVK